MLGSGAAFSLSSLLLRDVSGSSEKYELNFISICLLVIVKLRRKSESAPDDLSDFINWFLVNKLNELIEFVPNNLSSRKSRQDQLARQMSC